MSNMKPSPSMRAQVDRTWHGDVDTVRIVLALDSGEIAEVQVAKVGAELVVAIGGDVERDSRRTREGHTVIRVAPTAKAPA